MSHKFYGEFHVFNEVPLGNEHQRLDKLKYDGCGCRACGQRVKFTDVKVRPSWIIFMRRCLFRHKLALFQVTSPKFDVPMPRGHDWYYLDDFGMMVRCVEPETNRKKAGWWRVTEYGRNFLFNNQPCPAFLSVFDDTVRYTSKETVTLEDVRKMKGWYDNEVDPYIKGFDPDKDVEP